MEPYSLGLSLVDYLDALISSKLVLSMALLKTEEAE